MLNESKKLNVAVAGAVSLVGEAILDLLAERKFPCQQVYALGTGEAVGKDVNFGRKSLEVNELADFDFTQVEIVFWADERELAVEFAPRVSQSACVMIDLSGAFAEKDDVPLIVADVNEAALSADKMCNMIACPSSATVQLLTALMPLHKVATIARIDVATYQAVSSAGKAGVQELASQTANLLNARSIDPGVVYPKQLAFNVLPQVSEFLDNRYTQQEMQLSQESRRVLDNTTLSVNVTAVTVPVFFGSSMAVHLETEQVLPISKACQLLEENQPVKFYSEGADYPVAVDNALNETRVLVGRLRADLSHPKRLNLWIVADNIRVGSALNSVKIAELLRRKALV
ncbi:MAG: aspartate-semialdehyde dehydrogenase [Proteobacteria bacterium]|nr:MAG: aspartate-semialdehyde dehydrogenase [Pseudomonadota bacterium]